MKQRASLHLSSYIKIQTLSLWIHFSVWSPPIQVKIPSPDPLLSQITIPPEGMFSLRKDSSKKPFIFCPWLSNPSCNLASDVAKISKLGFLVAKCRKDYISGAGGGWGGRGSVHHPQHQYWINSCDSYTLVIHLWSQEYVGKLKSIVKGSLSFLLSF